MKRYYHDPVSNGSQVYNTSDSCAVRIVGHSMSSIEIPPMTNELIIKLGLQTVYDEQYDTQMSPWRELGAKYKAQNILDVCQGHQFQRVLECGAGEGSILMHLDQARFADELYAVEIAESGVAAIVRRQLPSLKEVKSFNGYTIPYPDGYFDLVILSHVLEHVEHPRLLLRDLRRVSRFLVIEVPLDYSPKVDQKVDHFLAYGHINIFTPALLRFLLKSESFTILTDKHSLNHPEVIQYSMYVNAGQKKTVASEFRRRYRYWRSALRRRLSLPRQRNEFRYNAYTVLCTHQGGALQIF